MKMILELEELRNPTQEHGFLDVFHLNRHRNATDPRDMIFGLIGLTIGLDESVIQYQATIQATYQHATLKIIDKSGTLDVFHHNLGHRVWTDDAWHILERSERYKYVDSSHLPSWVPNWNRRYKPVYLSVVTARHNRLKLFHAAKATKAKVDSIASGRLAIEGLDLLRVERVSESKRPFFSYIDIWSPWRKMADVDGNPDRGYVAGGNILNAYWRTLCFDSSIEGVKGPLRRAIDDDQIIHDGWWWSQIVRGECIKGRISHEECEKLINYNLEPASFDNTVADVCSDRSFFVSTTGYIGLVPSETVVGDRICVLSGGRTPFVLRPHLRRDDADGAESLEYTFVGDAYVHGLMDGEAIDMVESGTLEMQTLILR